MKLFSLTLKAFASLFPIVLLIPGNVHATAQDSNARLPAYTGAQQCMSCHRAETSQWRDSDHDLAMQKATEATVLGDFNDSKISHFGVESLFYRDGEQFRVKTEGPDGSVEDYQILYTFGVRPLQQYLIKFPDGRIQTLGLAWDTRDSAEGGQRWFHLYPNEKISHDDELHWTGPQQNWNHMCAECHSTNYRKGYNQTDRQFDSHWGDINVSCEACHGPGSKHIDWAMKKGDWQNLSDSLGLTVKFDEREHVQWILAPGADTAHRSEPRTTSREIDTCARCHSRRAPLSEDFTPGDSLLDHYLPSLLDEQLYYPDGQIKDEVYVYGSFLQSRMYHQGVTCSDCHNPHSLKLKRPGDQVCLQCHRADTYQAESHHFHPLKSTGSSCVECHMPATSYMVVDPRHDHSIRIPRPDLSLRYSTPNACTNCHTDKNNKWANRHFRDWYGDNVQSFQDYAGVFHAARWRQHDAVDQLHALLEQSGKPAIVRATAISELAGYGTPVSAKLLEKQLGDSDPLVRAAAAEALIQLPVANRVPLAFNALQDPIRAVRHHAVAALFGIPRGELSGSQQQLVLKNETEYLYSQKTNADRADGQFNLGNYYLAQAEFNAAETHYIEAIALDPDFLPAYINLADLYRHLGKLELAQKTLNQAVKRQPQFAAAHHALGLIHVSKQSTALALDELKQAHELEPGNARYGYVYAVALNSLGKPVAAIELLEQLNAQFPDNPDILGALVSYYRDGGNLKKARQYYQQLESLTPSSTR